MADKKNTDNFYLPETWDDIPDTSIDLEEITKIPHAEVRPAYYSDPWFYRIIGITLSIVIVLSVPGMFFLAYFKLAIPEAIVAVASTAVGALAGVLAGSKR